MPSGFHRRNQWYCSSCKNFGRIVVPTPVYFAYFPTIIMRRGKPRSFVSTRDWHDNSAITLRYDFVINCTYTTKLCPGWAPETRKPSSTSSRVVCLLWSKNSVLNYLGVKIARSKQPFCHVCGNACGRLFWTWGCMACWESSHHQFKVKTQAKKQRKA